MKIEKVDVDVRCQAGKLMLMSDVRSVRATAHSNANVGNKENDFDHILYEANPLWALWTHCTQFITCDTRIRASHKLHITNPAKLLRVSTHSDFSLRAALPAAFAPL